MFKRVLFTRTLAAFAGVSLMALASTSTSAIAANHDDLEERVALLEATTARKGNRKVSLTISGHVNQALLIWDDGVDSDAFVVGNANDDLTIFRFEGAAKISSGWTAGYLIEIELTEASSAEVTQNNDDGTAGLGISEVSMYIESEQYGKVTWGFAGQPSDGAPEQDLSGAQYAGYAAIGDVAGGFNWRVSNGGALSGITLGDVFDDLNGDTFNIIRYDTPTFAGFTLSASWGENDIWDVALTFEKEIANFEVAAAIAYTENSDFTDAGLTFNNIDTVAGSISVLHAPSGLNLTFAAGTRDFNDATKKDADFYYVKAGLYRAFNSLGKTAFYAEYGQYNDFANSDDAAVLAALTNGNGTLINGSEATVYGVGLVQYVDAAAMQLYVAYRHHELELDAINGGGAAVVVNGVEDFDTVLVGGRIEF